MVARPEPLTKQHNLEPFDCGKPALSNWLKKHAIQSQESQHTRTMVISEDDKVVIGYYSYNVISVEHEESPDRVKKGLARHPIPVFLIARLALDTKHQGKGLGTRLMLNALKGAAAITKDVPIRAVIVDAIDDEAKEFYSGFDFVPFPADRLRMWLLMKDLMRTIKHSPDKD